MSSTKIQNDKRAPLTIAAIAVFILVLLIVFTIINNPTNQNNQTHLPPPNSFTFNNATYNFTAVELTLAQQEHGLMNTTVTNSTFMLFVFNGPSIYPFWMEDTYYPLDIIWINSSKVVYIVHSVPCSWYSPNQTACIIYNNFTDGHVANYVIEAQEGFTNRTGMAVGSTVKINLNES